MYWVLGCCLIASVLGHKQWCHCLVPVFWKPGQLVLWARRPIKSNGSRDDLGVDWWTVWLLTSEHTLFIGFGEPPWSPWSSSRCFDQVWLKQSWAQSFRRNWWPSWDGTSLNTHTVSQGAFLSALNFKKQKKQPDFDAEDSLQSSTFLMLMAKLATVVRVWTLVLSPECYSTLNIC